ncbi:hypothetical protein BC826DRAFT_95002 [Russula brevipes]|nr:hypothetical protein BC826DRAFT_95002 [Russula brevipes]
MTWETTRAEAITFSERDSYPLLLSCSSRFRPHFVSPNQLLQTHTLPATMHFISTLVITFLVPILDIFASVGAAPSGFQVQSRDEAVTLPINLDFITPKPGQEVHRNEKFVVFFYLRLNCNFSKDFAPPFHINFVVEQDGKPTGGGERYDLCLSDCT